MQERNKQKERKTMKKLMIAFAAVAMAAASAMAGSVNWGVQGCAEEYTAYLLTSIQSSYATQSAFAAAAVDSFVLTKTEYSWESMVWYEYEGSSTATADSITKTASFYVALVKDSTSTTFDYVEVNSLRDYVDTEGTIYAAFNQFKYNGKSGTFESVPEQTSALLMLLGLAGLALKRKQA